MKMRHAVLPVVFLAISLQYSFPQARVSTPQPPSTTTRPESIQDSGIYGYWTHMTDQGRADGALLGKLTVEGEPMLWEPVPISVMCNGKAVHTTSTDPKGRFLIRTTSAGGLTLQNDTKRQMETFFEGCTVEAALAGSAPIPLPSRSAICATIRSWARSHSTARRQPAEPL